MIKIKPDKEGFLTQWDIDRKVVISGLDGIEGVKVHFASPDDDHGAYVVNPVEQDGAVYADVPNILLTESGRVDVFVYTTYTRVRASLMVFPREKPDDYVYTETEVLKYEDFVERLDELETQKEDKANKVTTVDDNSDDEHYPTAKAVYKAIPKSLKNPYSLTFTGAVTGSYDGSKPMTFNIPVGSSGTDISLGVTGASVGDIIKVKQVDADGKPTAWEAVTAKLANPNALTFTGAVTGSYDGSEAKTIEIPSGVGGGVSYRSWSKVWTLAVAEDIAGFEASNIDLDGKSEIMIVFISDSTASRSMTNGRLLINGVDVGKVLFNSLPLKKDSHSFIIIGRADDGIEYTTMAAKAEYQSYPWQGDVNVVHRMVRGTNTVISWIADSTIEITQGSATLGQGITIEIYVR